MQITLIDIYRARRRIGAGAYHTPLERSEWLSGVAGCDVYLKLECWQRTRSFKIRGALSAIRLLTPEEAARGLAAASAGNHGQGVALAAREAGVEATIFVPASAPETKKAHIRAFGATLREVEGTYDDAEAAAKAWSQETGSVFVHPYADPRVAAGQGTIGLEILEDLPDVRDVVVPVGGGGLIAGIGAALHAASGTGVRVAGVQSEATRAMYDAFAAGGPVEVEVRDTLADGLAGAVEAESYAWARAVTDRIHLVSEDAIAESIRELYRRDGIVAEGSAATAAALLLERSWRPAGPVVLVITGGNIDGDKLAEVLK